MCVIHYPLETLRIFFLIFTLFILPVTHEVFEQYL